MVSCHMYIRTTSWNIEPPRPYYDFDLPRFQIRLFQYSYGKDYGRISIARLSSVLTFARFYFTVSRHHDPLSDSWKLVTRRHYVTLPRQFCAERIIRDYVGHYMRRRKMVRHENSFVRTQCWHNRKTILGIRDLLPDNPVLDNDDWIRELCSYL